MGLLDTLGLSGIFGGSLGGSGSSVFQTVTTSNTSGQALNAQLALNPLQNAWGNTGYTIYTGQYSGWTGYYGTPYFFVKPGISYPENDRFRLSVALTEWGLALDDGHVRAIPGEKPRSPWMDGAELVPVKEMPEGYFVVWHKRLVQIYQMSTPLDEGLIRAHRLENGVGEPQLSLDESMFKTWTVG